jgi:hypothetical protein
VSSLGRILTEVVKHGPEVLETATEVAKLGASVVQAAESWVNGDGPEPGELVNAPELVRMRLSQARLERLAAGPVFCKHCPFAKHVHYEHEGKLVTPSCPGFEAR